MQHAHDDSVPLSRAARPEPRVTEGRGPTPVSAYAATPTSMLRLQRLAGNAAVAAMQREVAIDEMTSTVDTGAGAGGGAGPTAAAPAATLGDGTGPAAINGSTVDVSGGAVNLHSPMVRADGVLQADTIIANSVVGASYSPGAGNLW